MEELERTIDELEDLVSKELDKIVKKSDLTPVEVKNATDAMCLLEKSEILKAMRRGIYERPEESYGMRNSYGSYGSYGSGNSGNSRGSYGSYGSYGSGNSRGSYGSYGSNGSGESRGSQGTMRANYSYGPRYSMGYSGHSIHDRMVACLESMMDSAESDYEREEIRRGIGILESNR